MRAMILATITATAFFCAGPAAAQEGLATSSTLGGHNTIQAAPSGGSNRQAVGDGGAGAGDSVQPTEAEKQEEQRNNAVTDICKGC